MSTTLRDGNWSDATVWDVVPNQNTDVIINHNILADVSVQAKQVTISDGHTLTLGSGNILELWGSLVNRGTFFASIGGIKYHVADDRLFTGSGPAGPDPLMPDFHPEDIGLWGMGDTLIHAPEVTTHVNAAPVSQTGTDMGNGILSFPTIVGNMATLQNVPTGWQSGDSLVVCAVDGSYKVVTLSSIAGTTISLSASFTAPTLMAVDAAGVQQFAYPKVCNLSRRFVIWSADVVPGNYNHRAHTAYMMGGCAELENVEFRNLGTRAKLGRYPVHFHKMGVPTEPCCHVTGCSIWQDVDDYGSRFVAVHNSSYIVVDNNVALKSRGHGFFSETGGEAHNQWTNNVSIDVLGPEELTVANTPLVPNNIAGGGVQVNAGSHHYWMYDGSVISGNVAVGPKSIPGVVIPTVNEIMGILVQKNTLGVAAPNQAVDNCEFYGAGNYATWSLVEGTVFNNPKSLYCGAQFNHDPGFISAVGGVPQMTINNPLFLFNGIGKSTSYFCQLYFNAGIVTGKSITVNGGILGGEVLIHAHYHALMNFIGTQFRGTNLISPAYWQCMVSLLNCGFNVNQLEFHQNYLPHQEEPGLLSIRNGVGNVFGVNYTDLDADFSLAANVRFPGFAGTPELTVGERLINLAPLTGFLARPPIKNGIGGYTLADEKYPPAVQWSVCAVGTSGIYRQGDPVRFTQPAWQSSRNSGNNGYPYGIPPGVYDVRIKQKDGTIVTTLGVPVNAGQVTQM